MPGDAIASIIPKSRSCSSRIPIASCSKRRAAACTIDIEPDAAVFTIDEALEPRAIVWGTDNIFKTYLVSRGDVDAALPPRRIVVEGEYETGAQEQLYIEPNGMLAVADPDVGRDGLGLDAVSVLHPQRAEPASSTCRPRRVRVVQMETGGGFGGKEEYPSIIAGHAALLAWKSGRPVKLVYDRAEDMVATTKRHPVADAASDGGRSRTASCWRWTSTS